MPSLNCKILNGLPVTIGYDMEVDDDCDLRIGDWYVSHICGKKCTQEMQWLYKRIAECKDQIFKIERLIFDDYEKVGQDGTL